MNSGLVGRKRKVGVVYDDKKRKAGADEFEMLGLCDAGGVEVDPDSSALEGLRRGCKSSLRNG